MNKHKIITDARILKALKNRGFIIDYDKKYKYVNAYNYYNSNKNIYQSITKKQIINIIIPV